MRILIEDSKIQTKMLDYCLYACRSYTYHIKGSFRKKYEEDLKEAQDMLSLGKYTQNLFRSITIQLTRENNFIIIAEQKFREASTSET